MREKRIKINVGGVHYETTNSTLLSINGGSNYFSLFLSRIDQNNDNIDEIFIDRNGTLFQYILDYLRTGSTVNVPNKIHIIKGLIMEADFYLLESLSRALEKRLETENLRRLNMNMTLMNIQNSKIISDNEYEVTKNENTIENEKKVEDYLNFNKLNYKCEFSLNEDF